MKYAIEDTTLTAIGDAVRAKGETTELIKVSDLANAIANLPSGGGGGIEVEPIVLTGNQSRGCVGELSNNYIKLFGDTISTSNITNCGNMFYAYKNDTIPFDINCSSNSEVDMSYMFSYGNIKQLPRIINAKPMGFAGLFKDSKYLREIPDDFYDTWNWSYFHSKSGNCSEIFYNCYSLRKVPTNFLKNIYKSVDVYRAIFTYCVSLDEINGLVVLSSLNLNSNYFSEPFDNCSRLKNMTFETNEDGTPKTANWNKQVIDLSYYVGYRTYATYILNYNSGITADKQVKDDATYQALKNDPDWFTTDINYSRYNRTSAVNTINSLPDASAYGTNTIKFTGASGALTDGGAINTMTEEEIAVAAAKGWTVSLV